MAFRLAFDIGSKNIKCAIGDENDDIVAIESIRPAVSCSDDGFCRSYDHSTYWNDIIALARRTIATSRVDAASIKYITCSSIRPSCTFVDAVGNLVHIGSSFDLRGINVADTIEAKFEAMSGSSFFKATGHFPLLMYPPARYAWYRESEPDVFARIARYMPVDSWLLGKFGAEDHANIASAAESGFLDITRKDWCPEWTELLELPPDFLPPVVDSGEIVGDVSKEIQQTLGLPRDAAVVSGMPDTQAALVGAGCINDLDAAIVFGSTAPVQAIKRDLAFDEAGRLWTTRITLKNVVDSHVIEASTGITGQLLAWIGGLLFDKDGHFKMEHLAAIDEEYARLDAEELANPAEAKDVLAFLGPDLLASSSSAILPGVVVFPTPGTVDEAMLSRRQLVAATFENIMFAARKNLEIVQAIAGRGVDPPSLLGGMTRSHVFCQRFADLLNGSVRTTMEKESTISGLFHACSVAAGTIKSGKGLKQLVESGTRVATVSPRDKMVDVLQRRYARWITMREKVKGL